MSSPSELVENGTAECSGDNAENKENATAAEQRRESSEDLVTPWEVSSRSDKGVDYDKLISEYKIVSVLIRINERLLIRMVMFYSGRFREEI